MFGALPASGRPSDSWATAFGTSQFAWSGTPGLLVSVLANCTSIFGIV